MPMCSREESHHETDLIKSLLGEGRGAGTSKEDRIEKGAEKDRKRKKKREKERLPGNLWRQRVKEEEGLG